MACTCSFLATVDGFHEPGCALQCRATLDDWPLGVGYAFATVGFARCAFGQGHDGDHEAVVLSPPREKGQIRIATRVAWRALGPVGSARVAAQVYPDGSSLPAGVDRDSMAAEWDD